MRSTGSKSSTSSRAPETVLVGRIRRAHGIRGEVVIEVLSDVPGRFAPGSRLLASRPGQPPRSLTVLRCRPHQGVVLVTFEGVEDRTGAEALAGRELAVAASEVPPAAEGEYFYFQLIGCRCSDRGAGELGEVVDVLEDGGGLLLIVEGPEGTLPIPFVRSFLKRVDVEEGVIELELPPGLVETCASRSSPSSPSSSRPS
ncbi:MAG TPA: ribosome maturation factor RimM [Thermoanaerobaculia bacterium]|nr:ribosome maturation factor RimM [Thermoanaerobaculia bacterium]